MFTSNRILSPCIIKPIMPPCSAKSGTSLTVRMSKLRVSLRIAPSRFLSDEAINKTPHEFASSTSDSLRTMMVLPPIFSPATVESRTVPKGSFPRTQISRESRVATRSVCRVTNFPKLAAKDKTLPRVLDDDSAHPRTPNMCFGRARHSGEKLLYSNRRLLHSSQLGETRPTPAHAEHGRDDGSDDVAGWKPLTQRSRPEGRPHRATDRWSGLRRRLYRLKLGHVHVDRRYLSHRVRPMQNTRG
jgi:hypothetical protein